MSGTIRDGGPAFPINDDGTQGVRIGLSKREWFAGMALQSLIAKSPFWDTSGENGEPITDDDIKQFRLDIAASANAYADAMIAECQKGRES